LLNADFQRPPSKTTSTQGSIQYFTIYSPYCQAKMAEKRWKNGPLGPRKDVRKLPFLAPQARAQREARSDLKEDQRIETR